MGYDLQKRLAILQEQAEQSKYRSVRFSRLLVYSFIAVSLFIAFIVSPLTAIEFNPSPREKQVSVKGDDSSKNLASSPSQRLQSPLEIVITDRTNFLGNWPFSWNLGRYYQRFAYRLVAAFFLPSSFILTNRAGSEINPFDYIETSQLSEGLTARVISLTLRLLFILMTFSPLWIVAIILGFLMIRYLRNQKIFDPILTICDRGKSPFYSGIYGPFRLNNSFAGTDIACPGLACPDKAPQNYALNHSLIKLLKNAGAFCQTSFELVQVILAYRDFPCIVDDEKPAEEETGVSQKGKIILPSDTGAATNNEGTIEGNALELLPALLSCHRILRSYFKAVKKKSATDINYDDYKQFIQQVLPKCSPLVKLMLDLITPQRAFALAALSPTAVACAYLSIEAGKCMVYKKIGKGFIKVSQFPHLQARAILHSIHSYHDEFDGDTRLIIRQAILCSRRHGDFARAFLPENMPLAARALRDILEVCYASGDKRKDIAIITELDAQLEEIANNWRNQLVKHLESFVHTSSANSARKTSLYPELSYIPEKGLAYKSVILLPQETIIKLALTGYSRERLCHISSLIRETRKFAKLLTVSARLPGFQRQVEKLEEFTSRSVPISTTGELSTEDQWLIIHRMFTRYNWLSTRVGDDGVPENGIVSSVVVVPPISHESIQIVGSTTMVPLRQRRYRDVFGQHWERDFYMDAIHPDNIAVFVDNELYLQDLTKKQDLARKGLLDSTASSEMLSEKPVGNNG